MILGIETSTPRASLALYNRDADKVLWSRDFTTERAHNAVIFEPVSEILEQYRDQLTGIVVGVGPGSYSGVRVGIAVSNGLGLALGLPTKGRSSLEAWNVSEDTYAVISDARRKSYAVAEVIDRRVKGEPELVDAEGLKAKLSELASSGVPRYSADAKVVEAFGGVSLAHPDAVQIAKRSGGLSPDRWRKVPLEPHYLRAPYITSPKNRAQG